MTPPAMTKILMFPGPHQEDHFDFSSLVKIILIEFWNFCLKNLNTDQIVKHMHELTLQQHIIPWPGC